MGSYNSTWITIVLVTVVIMLIFLVFLGPSAPKRTGFETPPASEKPATQPAPAPTAPQ